MDSTVVSEYRPHLVAASFALAFIGSLIALMVTRRIRYQDGSLNRAAAVTAGVALGGIGVWSMHFVGMFAFTLPIELGYRGLETFLSWVAAIVVSAIALGAANQGQLSRPRLVISALLMGAGICAMHYTGMAAAQFPAGSLCLSVDALAGRELGVFVILGTLMLLSMTMVTAILDARMQSKASRLSNKLQSTNAELQKANEVLQQH
eukprot:gene26363-47657_t